MQKFNNGHKHLIHRLSLRLTSLCVFLLIGVVCWQPTDVKASYNQPFYDYSRNVHFGFTLGGNSGGFHYEFSEDFYQNDTLLGVENETFPGLTLGAVSNFHLSERFNLRFIPSLTLNQRELLYEFEDGTIESREIESVLVEFPLLGKYKASRHGNFRFYILGGGKYSYDIASEADAAEDPQRPIVALDPNQFSAEIGLGFDIYFEFFKFSPEIKLTHGVNNILTESPSIYSQSFDGLYKRFFYISLHFEG